MTKLENLDQSLDNKSETSENQNETQNSNDEWSLMTKIAIGLGITGAVVATAALGAIALGFWSAGIAAGSVAARVQSGIGRVVAGGGFATLTYCGMTGVFTTAAAAGGATTAAGVATVILNNSTSSTEKDNQKSYIDRNLK